MDKTEVKEIRKKLGLTQAQLALRIGVSVTTVSRWETGKCEPLPFLADRIREFYERKGK